MINIEYNITPQESANATLDFITNRPVMRFVFKFMQYSCIVLCIGFAISMYHKQARVQDFVAVLFAVIWLLFYKPINRWVVRGSLKAQKFSNASCTYKIDKKSIFCKIANAQPRHIDWKNVKFVLQNKDGFIVPLTGIANAGKFIWLPNRGFVQENMREEFINLIQELKLKLKRVAI